MADKLENLVRQAETDITNQKLVSSSTGAKRTGTPKLSWAIGIWLIAIILAAAQFDEMISMFSTPAENKIESDLGGILTKASNSLRAYEISTGVLPPVLPNPAIRGLVKYERLSDHRYQLRASISKVTMIMGSSSISPSRQTEQD